MKLKYDSNSIRTKIYPSISSTKTKLESAVSSLYNSNVHNNSRIISVANSIENVISNLNSINNWISDSSIKVENNEGKYVEQASILPTQVMDLKKDKIIVK